MYPYLDCMCVRCSRLLLDVALRGSSKEFEMVEKKRAAFDELEARLNDGIDKCATASFLNSNTCWFTVTGCTSVTRCAQSARLDHRAGARSVRRRAEEDRLP